MSTKRILLNNNCLVLIQKRLFNTKLWGQEEIATAIVAGDIDAAEGVIMAVSKARLATYTGSLGSEDAGIIRLLKPVGLTTEMTTLSDEEIPGMGFTVKEARGIG